MTAAEPSSLILCVDDYENILDGWKVLLEGAGYRVVTAADATNAIQQFVSYPVEEVILDYQMPGTTGDVLARQMKALKPSVPILMLSSDTELSNEQLKTVDGFLSKAESISIFLERVKALLSPVGLRRNEFSISRHDMRPEIAEVIKPTPAHAKAA